MHHYLLIAALASSATNSSQETPLSELQRCARIADGTARLACYDHAAPILIAASDKKQVVVMSREDIKRTRRTLFGLPLPDLGIFGGSGDSGSPDDRLVEINTTVATAREVAYGRWAFTVAEGDVWETTDPSTTMFIRPGRSVSIKSSAFAYRARFGKDSWVRVKRIR